ncbi:MAG: energy-coupling factor transporter transmembrane component T, partial [Ruminiclostridium sp.]
MMKDTFSAFHPIVNFTYFTAVILFSMFFMHPIFLGIALMNAFAYSVLLKGKSAVKFNVFYMLPMLLFMAILNPAFNHQGVTI